jgi:hypothetical protein
VAAAVTAFVGSFVLVAVIVAGYAFKLGAAARGAPDPDRIQRFAEQVGPTCGPVLLAILTVGAAFFAARKAFDPPLTGLMVGLFSAAIGLLPAWPPRLLHAGVFVVIALAGLLGGVAASRGARVRENASPER